jgi:hypothetical protein
VFLKGLFPLPCLTYSTDQKQEGATKAPIRAIAVLTREIIDLVFDVRAGDNAITISSDELVVDMVQEWTSLGWQIGQSDLEVDTDHVGAGQGKNVP